MTTDIQRPEVNASRESTRTHQDGAALARQRVPVAPRPDAGHAADLHAARDASERLRALLRREHGCLADFLLALADFERSGAFRRLGHASLFDYLHRELGLSRAAAHFRKVASRLVATFPEVGDALRDGRLCLTSVVELSKVVTAENRREVVPRFFHCSRQEARAVAVELRPERAVPRREVVTAACTASVDDGRSRGTIAPGPAPSRSAPLPLPGPEVQAAEAAAARGEPGAPVGHEDRGETPRAVRPGEPQMTHPERRGDAIEPLTSVLRRLHITVSKHFLGLLAQAKAGQSHVQPDATSEDVLTAALELLLAQQRRRRASVPPKVKREVMRRDEGRCQWPLASGGVCGSTVRLEVDHVRPRGKGGASVPENCRILCRAHNLEAARQEYGEQLTGTYAPRWSIAREPGAATSRTSRARAPSPCACPDPPPARSRTSR